MLEYQYIGAPISGYLIAGSLKFGIHSIKAKRLAFDLIGLGGMPSTHISMVSSPVFLIGLNKGFNSALFGLGLTLLMVVAIDAMDLRRKVGQHARVLKDTAQHDLISDLRTHIGHKPLEVVAGMMVGLCVAFAERYLVNL